MKIIQREHIDIKKWDACIRMSSVDNIFCYSWYLDAVAENWSAVVEGDYEAILPLPFTKKLGVTQLYQPPFTRELSIIGDKLNWDNILELIAPEFKGLNFRSAKKGIVEESESRTHQFLQLKDHKIKYRTNAKRLIKKADKQFEYKIGNDPDKLIDLFSETVLSKIDSISKDDLASLSILMKNAMVNQQGELIEIHSNNEMVGAGFFLLDKNSVTYLKGAATELAKKEGAMFGLMNFAFDKYENDFKVFDFGGSDIENVANFYKKFGAEDRTYYHYTINNLPKWFRAIKKIRG
jgi:hypothetical protein